MKRTLLVGILGLSSTTGALAQGHIIIWNYAVQPYNQVAYWGGAVNDPNARIHIRYAAGVVTDESALLPGLSFGINPSITYDPGVGYGPGGYFDPQVQGLPNWQEGDTYTFQLVGTFDGPGAFGVFGKTPLWTEQNAIVLTSLPANMATTVPAWIIIPEPSILALAGIGLGAGFFGRRLGRDHFALGPGPERRSS